MQNKLFSKLIVTAAVVSTVVAGIFAPSSNITAQAASTTSVSNGWYYIKNVNSQLYVEVAGSSDAKGANVQQGQGTGTANQKWYVENKGNGYITIKSGMSNGYYLDVNGGKKVNGTNIQVWPSNGKDSQKFKAVTISNGVVALTTKCSSGKQAVDVYEWSTSAGGNIATWEYNGLACQQFKFESCNGSSNSGGGNNSGGNSGSGSGSGNQTPSGNTITVKNGGTSLSDAINKASKGTTIVIDGTIKSGAVNLKSGVNITGKNNATIDFSSTRGNSGRGITISGSGSTLSNFTVKNAADNGIFIDGNNNTFRNVTCCYNKDAGFQISNGGSNNKFYSCYSHHNADPKGENADGFACKLHSGAGNYFEDCVAEYNSDDGWDLYAAHGAVTFKNCRANYNGYCDGIYGDGNGFKLGGVDNKTPGVAAHIDPLNHVLEGCSAVGNYASGFDRNNQSGVVTMKKCIADGNKKYNYNWPKEGTPSALGKKVTFGTAIIDSCTSKNGKNNLKGATLKGNCSGF
ncbi:RICIN domain-containing protein [Butyrivibrio sp. YAB3001]|uniref:RICIN domain-containing protein n=1 Tax=Butyrivibrio sp. YAB3001 TaxID=1520812 RepID=UPI0008F64DEE|nr:RICIN domain-containing protein [Butyrivibrio sp. YAB3001]SFC47525.1 Right handed beta helix region [Butyrivibrio sp. YAB3001]